jgi:hypothetical protein
VESVALISGAKDLLAGLFSLIAIWRYVRFANNGRKFEYAIATLAFLAALLSKPSAVTVPLILFVVQSYLPLAASRMEGVGAPDALSRKRRAFVWLVPWLVLSTLFAILGALAQPAPEVRAAPVWFRPFIVGDSLAFYLWKLIWPANLGFDYGRRPAAIAQHAWFYVTWLVPASVAIALWKLRARRPLVFAGALVFMIAPLPNLGLVKFLFQQYSTVGNHYLYVSMFGVAMIVGAILQHVRAKSVWIGASCIVLVLMFLSFINTGYWQTDRTLFTHMAQVNPRSYMAHCNLAIAESLDYNDAAALRQIDLALQSEPLTPDRIDFLKMMQRDLRGGASQPAP